MPTNKNNIILNTGKIYFLLLAISSLFLGISCSNGEENFISTNETTSKDSIFPIRIDQNTSDTTVIVDGKTYVFHIHRNMPQTRAITGIGGSAHPVNPNATLATVPFMVSKGKYKKYTNRTAYAPFSALSGASIVLLRLDKFTFECKAPANAKQTSFDITNITEEGFATESASYCGFSIDQILSTTSGVIVKCSFYIQDGIAYNIAGQQLTPDTYYPLPGEQVRYQFTYELRK